MRCASALSGMLLLALLQGCVTTAPRQTQEPAVQTMPPAVEADFHDALEVMRVGEWEAALPLMQAVAKEAPKLASPHANLGVILEHLERAEEAEQAYLQALALQPDWAALHNRLGVFYRRNGQFDKALAQYRRALELEPELAEAHLNLAVLYDVYLGQMKPALEHYRRYQSLQQEPKPEVKMWIADLERRSRVAGQ